MADRIYGVDRGDTEGDVVEQATSPAKDVEVTVDLAVSLDRNDVLIALDQIRNHILSGDWPPA